MYDFNDTEKIVTEAWSDHLGQKLNGTDDLLAMGAHSLMMALVADRIGADFGVAVPIELCFEAPQLTDYVTEIHRLRCSDT